METKNLALCFFLLQNFPPPICWLHFFGTLSGIFSRERAQRPFPETTGFSTKEISKCRMALNNLHLAWTLPPWPCLPLRRGAPTRIGSLWPWMCGFFGFFPGGKHGRNHEKKRWKPRKLEGFGKFNSKIYVDLIWLSQWPTFKLLGITYLIGKIVFKLLFHGALAE